MDHTRHELLRQRALAALGTPAGSSEAVEGLRVVEAELELQAEELQRAYAASEAAKRRYEQLFRSAPVGLMVLDSVQLIMEANDAAAEFLRAPPRLLFGVSMTQFLHPGELGRWSVFLQRALPTEFMVRRWGGDRAVARLKILKVDGHSALLAIEDLTDLRSSVLQPRGSLPPYLGYFRVSGEPAVVLDTQSRRVVEATEGLCALMGASRADLLERKQEDLFAVADRPRAGLVIEALARQPQSQSAEVALCSRAGERIPVELTAAASPGEGLLLLRVRDRRAAAPAGGAPTSAMQEAERLEAVARLAGGVAHDLNNVLTAITSTSEVLLAEVQGSGSRVLKEGFEDLRSAAAYGVGVARSLLQLTRLGPQHHEPFDLTEVVRSATRLLERALPLQVRLRATVPDQPCVVVGNPSDWERVLINLAFNAADACPKGGVVQVVLEAGDEFHGLTVRDDGAGMSPEVKARAFEPFFTTKEVGRGTGLGLAQVATAVAAHQAQVTLESATGQGTAVVMRIPASRQPLPREAPPPPVRRAIRLLLVEDEPIVRKSLARRLRHLGLEVEAVPGGEEALAAVDLRAPEVVLTDLSMPGMDGLTLVRRLKQTHPGLPVIVMSGHVTEALRQQLQSLQVRQLDKPFGERELGAALEAVLPASALAGDVAGGSQVDAAELAGPDRAESQQAR